MIGFSSLYLQALRGLRAVLSNKNSPITLDILLGIRRIINLNISYDASFWDVCLTAFFGLFRKSNLLPVSDVQYDPNKQFSRSSF